MTKQAPTPPTNAGWGFFMAVRGLGMSTFSSGRRPDLLFRLEVPVAGELWNQIAGCSLVARQNYRPAIMNFLQGLIYCGPIGVAGTGD